MSGMIDKSEFVPHAPSSPGMVRVNHERCGAGSDTRARLYIWRKSNGIITAYCHNCGGTGVSSEHTRRRYRSRRGAADRGAVSVGVYYPPDSVSLESFPPAAKAWALKHLTEDEVRDNNLRYSPSERRVVVPYFEVPGNKYVGCQLRRIYPDDTGPKYLTYKEKGKQLVFRPQYTTTESNTCVLVEDAVSSIVVSRIHGLHSLAIGGVHVSDELLLTLVKTYDTIYVWLDNDNSEVKKAQTSILHRLSSQGVLTLLVLTEKDPKAFDVSEITDILKESFYD